MKYKVELIPSEEGFAVGCPELPGCWSQGATEEEALENIEMAISDYLAVWMNSTGSNKLAMWKLRLPDGEVTGDKSSSRSEGPLASKSSGKARTL